MKRINIIAAAALLWNASSWAADADAGRKFFQQQCVLCHSAEAGDNGGAQGPALNRIMGHPAASTSSFAYTQALRNAKLEWNVANLDKFLAAPTKMVPGTAMLIAVPDDTARANVIAYLQRVAQAVPSSASSAASATALTDTAEWRKDRPGRRHRITVKELPQPFATPSIRNGPKLVTQPQDAQLAVPAGFKVEVFAKDLAGPRRMLVTDDGAVLVSEMRAGRIKLLRAQPGKPASAKIFADNLQQPFGMAFYPDARNPQWLYVAETQRVVRFPYKKGDEVARGAPEVVAQLPGGSGHSTRDVVFSADGKRMFVAVGSATNVGDGMAKKSATEIKAWEAEHGLGAAWDIEADRAAVLVYEMNGDMSKPQVGQNGRIFASGLRNCVSLALQPVTNELWCTVNERDLLGDDLVPDYSTRVREGGFYGWPWYYLGAHEDPRLQDARPDLRNKVSVPDVLYQAHSAALQLTFYTASNGAAAFPKDYVGDAIVAFHGSWNRNFRTGYKLVRVHMNNGVATGEYQDFLTGFIVDDGNVWGRPVATVVMPDGALLVSDDGANQIYRIAYQP